MKKVLIVLLVLIGLAVAFVATRPANYHIERSATIAAPAEVVFAELNDFHRWPAWSPWEKLDPNMTRTYEGPESGAGASYHWSGNKDVGEGRMTILESTPGQSVSIKIDFIKPFPGTSNAKFMILPQAPGVSVVWTMDGTHDFLGKAMCVVMPMDKMVGPDFEKGLANLRSVAETAAQSPATTAPTDSIH